jgi:hypothetical protein
MNKLLDRPENVLEVQQALAVLNPGIVRLPGDALLPFYVNFPEINFKGEKT